MGVSAVFIPPESAPVFSNNSGAGEWQKAHLAARLVLKGP